MKFRYNWGTIWAWVKMTCMKINSNITEPTDIDDAEAGATTQKFYQKLFIDSTLPSVFIF